MVVMHIISIITAAAWCRGCCCLVVRDVAAVYVLWCRSVPMLACGCLQCGVCGDVMYMAPVYMYALYVVCGDVYMWLYCCGYAMAVRA